MWPNCTHVKNNVWVWSTMKESNIVLILALCYWTGDMFFYLFFFWIFFLWPLFSILSNWVCFLWIGTTRSSCYVCDLHSVFIGSIFCRHKTQTLPKCVSGVFIISLCLALLIKAWQQNCCLQNTNVYIFYNIIINVGFFVWLMTSCRCVSMKWSV